MTDRSAKISNFLIFVILLSLFAILVSALGTNSVHLVTPANDTWTNDTDYPQGFEFWWHDQGDDSCGLNRANYIISSVQNENGFRNHMHGFRDIYTYKIMSRDCRYSSFKNFGV